MLKLWRILFLAPLLFACQSEGGGGKATSRVDLLNALPGTWEAVSLRVLVNTADGTDSSYVFEVKEEEWVRRLGALPVKTYFMPNHKYRQEFRGINDSLLNTSRGIWNVFGDTLMMIEANATYQYQVSLRNGLAEFRDQLDWDGDGQNDDEYLGVHRKISRSTE